MHLLRAAVRPLAYPLQLLIGALQRRRERRPVVLRLRLDGALDEELTGQPWRRGPHTLLEWIELLEAAGVDRSIEAVALRIGTVRAGWAQIDELRCAIARLRSGGKRVFVLLERAGQHEYFLASAADRVAVVLQATIELVGLRAEVTFWKGALDHLGVQAHFEAAGEFKSLGEPFMREGMSDEFRESLDTVLRGVHEGIVAGIAESRGLDEAAVQALLDAGPYTAGEARDAGLVDDVLYPDRWPHSVREALGRSPDEEPHEPPFVGLRYLSLQGWELRLRRWGGVLPRIAVLMASGNITESDSARSPAGRIGWRALTPAVRALAKDRSIAAVVLRVDSPGGSGRASDLLWRELRRLRKRKPLVASMGNTAASGGYYLAMAADEIFASPLTITGSIGVVAGKFDVSGLLERAGIHQEVLSYGEHAGLFSMSKGFTDSERARLRSFLTEFYDVFVGKAASCRGVPHDELEQHARGRIWTGEQARQRRLLDRTGGLSQAIEAAAARARIVGPWDLVVAEAARPGPLARLGLGGLAVGVGSGLLAARGALASLLGGCGGAAPVSLEDLAWDEPVQARMPFDLRLR